MITFLNWLNEYGINPNFEIPKADDKIHRKISKLSVDHSKSEIIPIILDKKTILALQNIYTNDANKFGFSVIERLKDQGEQAGGSQNLLVVYVSNEDAQGLKELAQSLAQSQDMAKKDLGIKLNNSIKNGIGLVSKK